MATSRAALRWLGAALAAASAASAPAHAQVTRAHDDAEWQADRQAPYAGAGWRESEGGTPPIAFPSSGVALRSWIPLADFAASAASANDCWGYVSPSGREYALIGLSLGTAVVEVTDPANATIVGVIGGPVNDWRDIRTYRHYAYVVTEGAGGIQVIDLSAVDAGVVTLVNTVTTGGRLASHNVVVNEASGRLYRAGGGGNSPPQGLRIYSLADPAAPVFVGAWHDRYCHDAQVVMWGKPPWSGVEVAFCYANDTTTAGNPTIEILDASDPLDVSRIGSINLSQPPIFSHPASYSHQGWLSPDHRYVYFDDEVDEQVSGNPTTTRIVDVSDLANPVQVGTFTNGNTARDHNLFTLGSRIYEANYRSGLRVFDASDPLAPVEVAYFDTYPTDDLAHYNGLWGVYPYLPSGTVIGSDIEKGLFVWTIGAPPVPGPGGWLSGMAAALLAAVGIRFLGVAPRARRRGGSD